MGEFAFENPVLLNFLLDSGSTEGLVTVVYNLGVWTLKYTEWIMLKCSIHSLKMWEAILDWSLLLFKF